MSILSVPATTKMMENYSPWIIYIVGVNEALHLAVIFPGQRFNCYSGERVRDAGVIISTKQLCRRHFARLYKKAKIFKQVTSHTFRHSFASHLLQANYNIHTIQELLGHSDMRTIISYILCEILYD